MKTADDYRKSYPNKTDSQIIESLSLELGDKVDTIHRLLKEKDEHAIGFLEWKDKLQLDGKLGLFDRGFSSYDNGNGISNITSEELLAIYNEQQKH